MGNKKLENRIKESCFPDRLLEHWRSYQCPDCKKGDRSKCSATKENGVAYREEPDGKRHYYCFIGCLMLDLSENCSKEGVKKVVEAQWNDEGHYEKIARG